jgi:hypothetical protein
MVMYKMTRQMYKTYRVPCAENDYRPPHKNDTELMAYLSVGLKEPVLQLAVKEK